MSERYIFKKEFEPIALVGENILILPDNRAFKVVYIEQLPIYVKDFGPIAAGSEIVTGEAGVPDLVKGFLEMPKNELAQIRFKLLDDIEVRVFQPRRAGRFTTNAVQFVIDKRIEEIDPTLKLTEIFQFEDRSLAFIIRNPTNYNLSSSRILFMGYRYVLKELSQIPEKYVAVPVGAYVAEK